MLENAGQHKNVSLNMNEVGSKVLPPTLALYPLPSPVVYIPEVSQILEAARTRNEVTVCNGQHNQYSLLCGSIDWGGGSLPLPSSSSLTL